MAPAHALVRITPCYSTAGQHCNHTPTMAQNLMGNITWCLSVDVRGWTHGPRIIYCTDYLVLGPADMCDLRCYTQEGRLVHTAGA